MDLDTITSVASQQLRFLDGVAATTIANYSTLLFNATSAKTVSAAITDNAVGTAVQVQNNSDSNISLITFSGNVAADVITIGHSGKSGSALFSGTVTGTNINIVGGNAASGAENSQATFADTVTVTTISFR